VVRLSAAPCPPSHAAPIPERRAGATYRFLQRMVAIGMPTMHGKTEVGQGAQNATRGNVRLHTLIPAARAVRQSCIAVTDPPAPLPEQVTCRRHATY
jgi:hypothetical protein